MIAEQERTGLWRGSFAAGQAAAETLTADVGRWSAGQEELAGFPVATRTIGSFADGQAGPHPPAAPRGRFSTGQERRRDEYGGSDLDPAARGKVGTPNQVTNRASEGRRRVTAITLRP